MTKLCRQIHVFVLEFLKFLLFLSRLTQNVLFAEMLVTDTEDIDIQTAEDISLTADSKSTIL